MATKLKLPDGSIVRAGHSRKVAFTWTGAVVDKKTVTHCGPVFYVKFSAPAAEGTSPTVAIGDGAPIVRGLDRSGNLIWFPTGKAVALDILASMFIEEHDLTRTPFLSVKRKKSKNPHRRTGPGNYHVSSETQNAQ